MVGEHGAHQNFQEPDLEGSNACTVAKLHKNEYLIDLSGRKNMLRASTNIAMSAMCHTIA